MDSLEDARRRYAEELRSLVELKHEPVVDAFARVPREHFLGDSPWNTIEDFTRKRATTSDPRALYRNVLVEIDRERRLNNGSPALWARLFDSVAPRAGERVLHVGAGTSYYPAVLSEMVGHEGRVTGVEIDPDLAAWATRNLAERAWVDVVADDGTRYDAGPVDLIVINAGATHPLPHWLERLEPGGRLLVPLTVDAAVHGYGLVLRVTRDGGHFAARFVSRVGIFPCAGARDPDRNDRLSRVFSADFGGAFAVQQLRTDPHEEADDCWLHDPDFCLSGSATKSIRASDSPRARSNAARLG